MATILFIYCRIHTEKDRRRGKQTYEIGSLISFGINLNKPFVDMFMIKDKHLEPQVRSVCTLGHQT